MAARAQVRGTSGSEALLAAVDLGSNGFHLVIGRERDGEISIVDRIREPVRLAAGLDEGGRLDEAALARMLASLERFRQRLAGVPRGRTRAIGTSAFRRTARPADLAARAGAALGVPVEVLSGPEEARLIYLGVAHDRPALDGWRLVVDIGGGSTECILGRGFRACATESLQIGCVESAGRFFPAGLAGRRELQRAETAARLELETIERRFRSTGWSECVGSSGTVQAVSALLLARGRSRAGEITPAGVEALWEEIAAAGHADALDLPGPLEDRRPLLAPGVAILRAVLESLGIETMVPTRASIREGVLHDLLGRMRHEDVRDRTIGAPCDERSLPAGPGAGSGP